MATPFIGFLEPSRLDGYKRGIPHDQQPSNIPRTFVDAMEVREEVFVKEQGVAAENEYDADDTRSCHWVIYASVNKLEELEVRDEAGNIIKPRRSSTRSTPIGTLRCVPFPHLAHPKDGEKYFDGVAQSELDENGKPKKAPASPPRPQYAVDRPTTFHDGKELYVKLGRLAVVKEFRGHRMGQLLIQSALAWLKDNPSFFDPSIQFGLDKIGAAGDSEIPRWKGLVCVHAQEQVVEAWKKFGFQVDEAMGKWEEEGIPHVGMFQRLDVANKPVIIKS